MNEVGLTEFDFKILEMAFPSERLMEAYLSIYEYAVKEGRTRFYATTLIEIIKQNLGILRSTIAAEYLKLLDSQGAFWHPDSQRPNLFVVKPPHEIIEKDGGEDE